MAQALLSPFEGLFNSTYLPLWSNTTSTAKPLVDEGPLQTGVRPNHAPSLDNHVLWLFPPRKGSVKIPSHR